MEGFVEPNTIFTYWNNLMLFKFFNWYIKGFCLMLIFIIKCYDTWRDLHKSDMWVYYIVTRNLVNQWYDWKIKPTNYIKLLEKSLGFLPFHYFSFGFIIFLLLAWLANYVVSIATSIDHWNNESHSNSPAVKSLMLTTQLLFSYFGVAFYLHDWLICQNTWAVC